MIPLKTQAIQTALTGNWQEAVALNLTILEETPTDVDALNRLAFAFSSIGNVKEAKSTYKKVLEIDDHNPIALKNLKKLSSGSIKTGNGFNYLANNLFIEEPGKTKVVELINVAEQKLISRLRNGEFVTLVVKRMKIFVLDNEKQYIGMLPDDIGRRLIRFIEGGNTYEAYVKTVSNHKVTVFAREVKRAAGFKNQPSFLTPDKSKFALRHEEGYKPPEKAHGKDNYEDSDDVSSEEEPPEESL